MKLGRKGITMFSLATYFFVTVRVGNSNRGPQENSLASREKQFLGRGRNENREDAGVEDHFRNVVKTHNMNRHNAVRPRTSIVQVLIAAKVHKLHDIRAWSNRQGAQENLFLRPSDFPPELQDLLVFF